MYPSPLSAEMNTKAAVFPAATVAAVFKSLSLRDEEIVVPSVFALAVIAERGSERYGKSAVLQ